MSDFLTPIVKALSDALSPLEISFSNKEELEAFLFKYGWDYRVDEGDLNPINTAFAVIPFFDVLFENLDELINGSDEERFLATVDVLEAVKNLVTHISDLAPGGLGGLPAPFDQANFWSELSEALFPDLLAIYLKSHQRAIYCILHITGVIQYQRQTPAEAGRVNYTKTVVDWNQLGTALANPYDAINDLYKWNKSGQTFDHEALLRAVEECLLSLGVPASVGPPRPELATPLIHDNSILIDGVNELEIPLVDGVSPADQTFWKIGAVVAPITNPIKTHTPPTGLAISPLLQGEATQLYFSPDVYLQLRGAFDADNAITLKLFPDSLDIDTDLGDAVIEAFMELIGAPEEPWLLLGDREGSRLELEGFYAAYGVRGRIDDLENIFQIGTTSTEDSPPKKLRLAVRFSDDADGFINNLTGGDDIVADFAGTLTWSSKHGFAFEGSAGLEVAIPLHLELGPIEISTLYISLGVSNRDGEEVIKGDLGVGIVANLGPIVAVVENIGVRAQIVPVQNGQAGSIGNADLQFGFKPPNGVGLSIDVGVVKGGGYLYFDFDKEEYAGVLELDLSGIVRVTAVGLITTRMPDGSKGFSLLLIITAEFGSPIQLGFGFTLSGVGGLLGLNRTMRLEQIATGVRDGGINSIMFPEDVVANAPRIISDLKNYFPVEEGTFLIGPMVKIGWGTPNLITVSLGVIIEIPGNIAILGVLKLALPYEDAALVVIQVNFIGAIEFDKKRLWFFASLYESRVLFITLEGDMGLLVAWGEDANFVVSVGGFHPAFEAPALPFGELRRIAISILNTSFARIRVEAYFAVTSNSVQFGAGVELFFGVDAFNIDGHLAFDALFRFSPFYFIISISASLSVKVFGIGLFSVSMRGSLEGPSPWRVEGTGSISLLFFDIDVDFSHTWGEEEETTLPSVAVLPLLTTEYQKLENWLSELPSHNQLSVTLRSFEQSGQDLIMHPVGSLKVSQRAVPLGVTIDKVGNQKPGDANHFTLAVTTSGIGERGEVDESFARGQYFSESDSNLLSAPAFEPLQGGVELSVSGESYRTPKAVKRVVRYEKVIIDTLYRRYALQFYAWAGSLFELFLNGNAMSRLGLSRSRQKQLQPFDAKIAVGNTQYTVANNRDNTPLSESAMSFKSYSLAQEYMNQQVANNPNLGKQLHVIPKVEAKKAA